MTIGMDTPALGMGNPLTSQAEAVQCATYRQRGTRDPAGGLGLKR